MSRENNVLSFEKTGFSWPGAAFPLFKDLELSIPTREITCILGPSGCGKTTLLNLAGGFLSPSEGRILFHGREIRKPEKTRIMVFQDYNQLFPWKTVLKNVTFPMKIKDPVKARELLALAGLKEAEHLYPAALSGGMKQRAAIARALASEPELLLLDEPFDGLDAPTRRALQNTLLNLEGALSASILMVTHDIDEAVYLADNLLVLGAGRALSESRSSGARVLLQEKNRLSHPRNPVSEDFLAYKARLYSLMEGERIL